MADPVPFLVSAAEVRKRRVKCRECGQEVSFGAGSCPACGVANPGERPVRWGLLITLALILAALGGAVAWKLGFLDRTIRKGTDSGAAADSAVIESSLRWHGPLLRADLPRIRSAQFGAACLTPAPLFVYELDRTPSMFLLRLASDVPDPTQMTESLVKRYRLESGPYDIRAGRVFVWKTGVVSALRCESAVSAIEEVSY